MALLTGLLAVKASLAMLLLVAGISKAFDLPAFRESIAVLLPRPAGALPGLALAVAGTEALVGGISLVLPTLAPADLAVLTLCLAFLVVSTIGAWRHRGARCRCFGALTDQRFGTAGVARSAALAAAAAIVVGEHEAFAAMALPSPIEWGLIVAALVPTGTAFVLAGKVLRVARGQEAHAR
jgi:hypothetical protein